MVKTAEEKGKLFFFCIVRMWGTYVLSHYSHMFDSLFTVNWMIGCPHRDQLEITEGWRALWLFLNSELQLRQCMRVSDHFPTTAPRRSELQYWVLLVCWFLFGITVSCKEETRPALLLKVRLAKPFKHSNILILWATLLSVMRTFSQHLTKWEIWFNRQVLDSTQYNSGKRSNHIHAGV